MYLFLIYQFWKEFKIDKRIYQNPKGAVSFSRDCTLQQVNLHEDSTCHINNGYRYGYDDTVKRATETPVG